MTLPRERVLVTSLRNDCDQTREVVAMIPGLAARMNEAAILCDWLKVESLARRIEALTYRARLDAPLHAMQQEGGQLPSAT